MTCSYCTDPSYIRCRKHRDHICGAPYCTSLHRWNRGDCEFVEAKHPLTGWQGHVVSLVVALAVGCLIVWIVQP